MTHKFIVSLVVLCSATGLLFGSFASAATTTLSPKERTLIRTTLPLLDLAHIAVAPAAIQRSIIALARLRATELPTDPLTKTTTRQNHSFTAIPTLPFYSQFTDISSSQWQKVSCGIASIAMIIDHYTEAKVDADELLINGIKNGAYIESAGWSHQGLINLAAPYGLSGETIGLSHLSMADAFASLSEAVKRGPVIASVHYTFEPTNPIPHLVVISGVEGDVVHYSDPAEPTGNQTLSAEKFKSAWKKRYIKILPS